MEPTTQILWNKLSNFALDEALVVAPLSVRLARENRWAGAYVGRAIEEYKRFVLLAVTATQPVCPSDVVDQVWHYHLLDSASYWGTFCNDVLHFPLHHRPSRGGAAEAEHHRAAYQATLRRYREVFGEAPPEDIWPGANVRFNGLQHWVRVNLARDWVVSKVAATRVVPVLLGAGLVFGLTIKPVLNLPGSTFLLLYLGLWVLALWGARRLVSRSLDVAVVPGISLHPYEVAYLAGGNSRVESAAIAHLIAAESFAFDNESRVLSASGLLGNGAHPIEQALYTAVASGAAATIAAAGQAIQPAVRDVNARLTGLGLLCEGTVWPQMLAASPLLLALPKLCVGIMRHRPVGFLFLLGVLGLFVAIRHFKTETKPTNAANALLEAQRAKHPLAAKQEAPAPSPNVALRVALFGAAGLASLGLANIWQQSGSSPIGTDSDTGGDGSDGGGGCGGGCGGCGGCGGGCG